MYAARPVKNLGRRHVEPLRNTINFFNVLVYIHLKRKTLKIASQQTETNKMHFRIGMFLVKKNGT